MLAFPGCKINLGLHVLHRRTDGYHEIDTVFYRIPWSDILEFLPAEIFSFHTTGLNIPGDAGSNLCVRAFELLQKDFSLPPVQGHLHKVVPIGAGLGGGSADAVLTLRVINSIFGLKLPDENLAEYALRLGSDCPFFLLDKPARGTGRGEVLQPFEINLQGHFLVLVTPSVHISTAEAYAGVVSGTPQEDLKATLSRPITDWKTHLVNDFEKTVFARFPEIGDVKDKMYALGAEYASMSGSGSSVFGLFRSPVSLDRHFPNLPGWSGWL